MNQHKQIALLEGITDPLAACTTLGEAFAASGLFGCTKPQQGTVLALQCLATGMTPFELTQTYHVIDGKLSMRSDAMLSKFIQAGGIVEWISRTPEKVSAKWTFRNNCIEMGITMQELINSGVALGKGDQLKENYRRHPRQMLTARLVSEAVRLLAPEVVSGVYTPEEIQDIQDPEPEKPKPAPKAKPAPTPEPAPKTLEAEVVTTDPEQEFRDLLGEHYDLALNYFHATAALKNSQTMQHLNETVKYALKTRTADLITRITKK